MIGNVNQILFMAQSSMISRTTYLDIVSANLANTNTTGFKYTRANFQETLHQTILSGVGIRSSQTILDQGTLKTTGQPLDLAIQGEGYFGVILPSGETAYTRDGQFTLDSANQLVTTGGQRVDWSGAIPAGAEEVTVTKEGVVMARIGDTWSEAGVISLNRFPNASALTGYGQNLFLPNEISGEAISGAAQTDGYGAIISGALEQSNVNMANEMTNLISLQRGFEMAMTSFQNTDKMIQLAIQLRNG